MFAYILRAPVAPNEQSTEFFRSSKEAPGLIHAYSLQGETDLNESLAVAIWESIEAAIRYLETSPLLREVDQHCARGYPHYV